VGTPVAAALPVEPVVANPVRDSTARLPAADLVAALAAGLGTAALARVVLHSASVPLPVADWWLLLVLPLGAVAGIVVAALLGPHMPVLFEMAKFGLVESSRHNHIGTTSQKPLEQ
jgi:hypothetical protein